MVCVFSQTFNSAEDIVNKDIIVVANKNNSRFVSLLNKIAYSCIFIKRKVIKDDIIRFRGRQYVNS